MADSSDLPNQILVLMESMTAMIDAAQGIRKQLTDLGYADEIAQQVSSQWLISAITK